MFTLFPSCVGIAGSLVSLVEWNITMGSTVGSVVISVTIGLNLHRQTVRQNQTYFFLILNLFVKDFILKLFGIEARIYRMCTT